MYISEMKFSLWADFIERDFLDNEFKELIDKGIVNGATSNPAIFKNAILTSPAYKEQIASLRGKTPKEIYEAVAIFDIQKAADVLMPLHVKGDDGYVSIEVDPFLCDDATGTIAEGKRLYAQINRPNVMIKVPATMAGYEAMEALVAEGIAVNATLIFSKKQAIFSAKAFERGLLTCKKKVDTVISVFVSRIDRALDAELKNKGVAMALSGIYNAADIYNVVQAMKVDNCRTLFASTGVKGDELRASYYIDELLAPYSVNTAPIDTIHSYVQGGDIEAKLPLSVEVIRAHFALVSGADIHFDTVIEKQITDGLDAFKDAFSEILTALEA